MSTVLYLKFTPECVLEAYRHGIFPMADSETGAVEWYSPDPRAIVPLDGLHVSRRLARTIRSGKFEIRLDSAFEEVMRACANREESSWISEEFVELYCILHKHGYAHSVETWREGKLAGGLYGVSIGGAFMGESMFYRETDASKVALAALVDHLNDRGFALLDTQFITPHLWTMGAVEIPAADYLGRLNQALGLSCRF
jgi:leucyl/phenylalanyl-tRNA--protein transferase